MPDYRRAAIPGGTYFFTVVAYRRRTILCDPNFRAALRNAVSGVKIELPFEIKAWVLLPDHLHCIWSLPPGDSDFPRRWAMIKRSVSARCQRYHRPELATVAERARHELTLWQRRYWEHWVRDERDYKRCCDYIHYNPVKHGYVSRPRDWPYSTFHRMVKLQVYDLDWGSETDSTPDDDVFGE